MPIYRYAPTGVFTVNDGQRACCYFEFLHLHGTESSAPLETCPTCGNAIERVPSSFSSPAQPGSPTVSALKRAGKHEYAEAWAEGERLLVSSSSRKEPEKAERTQESTPAGRVLELTSGHVCTASCRHG
jgi:hypothetical protein